MQFKVKLLSFNEPASDSSRISREVVEQFMATEAYKNAIASRTMLGTMSHYPRNVSSGVKQLSSSISKTCGKDDLLIIVGESSPTHYITKLECGDDGWLYAYAELLNEEIFDSQAAENIKRLKGLLKSGCLIGCSAVILGYWDNTNSGDVLKRIVTLKGFDLTLNPSWKKAQVVSVTDDEGNTIASVEEKAFSEENVDVKYEGLMVKTFSDLSQFGNVAKTSKIDGKFTTLKAKEFSANNDAELIEETPEEKLASEPAVVEEEQKEFSAATLRERIRYGNPDKFSPRVRLRRLYIDYKQVVKQMGGPEKIDPSTMKTMRSLFAADLNMLMAQITPDIVSSGKQINTVLGCSALGVVPRKAAQALQMPYRMAFMEINKTGKLTPARFAKIKEAYGEFIKAMSNEVFGSSPIPEGLENEAEQEEGK